MPGYRGLLGYSLREALFLVRAGSSDDIVVAYPTVDTAAIADLACDERAASAITLMVDCVEHLDLIESAVRSAGAPPVPIRVAIDVDASYRPRESPRVHLGVRRSPVRTAAQAVALAREIVDRPGLHLDGLMAYEAQIAGVGDRPPGRGPARRRRSGRCSAAPLPSWRQRRAEVVAAVRGSRRPASSSTAAAPAASSGTERRGRRHRGHRRLAASTARTSSTTTAASDPDPGRAASRCRSSGVPAPAWSTAARRRLPRLRPGGRAAPARGAPADGAAARRATRAPARCRRRCSGRPRTACGSATGSTSATPRRASSCERFDRVPPGRRRPDRRRVPDLPRRGPVVRLTRTRDPRSGRLPASRW